MAIYQHDKVVPDSTSVLSKKEQVASMFDDISSKYDFLNRFLSAGIDISWRKKGLQQLKDIQPQIILDVATGTADLAILCSKSLSPKKIIGIDISEGMLEIGRNKIQNLGLDNKITLLKGNSESIDFPDHYFDAVMVSFGVRNFENLEKGLVEIKRVLKPGGKLMVLEFSRPKHLLIKLIYGFYMKTLTPKIGKLFSKNNKAYTYLDESIQQFPEREAFVNILNNIGYTQTYHKPLTFGICSIYCGKK